MKVNFNIPLRNFKGEAEKDEVTRKDKLVKELVCQCLFMGNGLKKESDLDNKKLVAYNLQRRIWDSTDAIEIEDKESVLIKEACTIVNAGGYGQIVELLNGNPWE